jgi:hypothetical protein
MTSADILSHSILPHLLFTAFFPLLKSLRPTEIYDRRQMLGPFPYRLVTGRRSNLYHFAEHKYDGRISGLNSVQQLAVS